jgi:hypothetical protein
MRMWSSFHVSEKYRCKTHNTSQMTQVHILILLLKDPF